MKSNHSSVEKLVVRGSQTVFWLILSWILHDLPWWAEFGIATLLACLLGCLLERRYIRVQVELHVRRRLVGAVVVTALAGGALLLGVAAHAAHARLALNLPLVVLGFFVGYAVRRTAARSVSPSLVESKAASRKARLFLVLGGAVLGFPSTPSYDSAAYLFAICAGVTAHWLVRELDYAAGGRSRRIGSIIEPTEPLTQLEWQARAALLRGRYGLVLDLAQRCQSFWGWMMAGIAELSRERPHEAVVQFRSVLPMAGTDKQRAKVHLLLALAEYMRGNELGVAAELRQVHAHDNRCPIEVLMSITLEDLETESLPRAGGQLIRLLRAIEHAHAPLATLGDELVKFAFGVDQSYFKDGLALALLRMNQLRYAAEVLDSVVRQAPTFALARYHQGLLFMSYAERTFSESERIEYLDMAEIAFRLAIRLAPKQSLTRARSMRRLEKLRGAPKTARAETASLPGRGTTTGTFPRAVERPGERRDDGENVA